MTWLVIVGLGVWLYLQQQALGGLRKRAENLEARLKGLEAERVAEPPKRSRKAAVTSVPTTTVALEPEPQAAILPVLAEAAAAPERIVAAEPLQPPKPPRPPINVAAWLSEHGLAWLGGGALALGGLFLATYAAQRGMFTPALRSAAAITAGFVMLGASEWMRRRMSEGGRGPVAALLAGAGAATLYGAVWASDRLYGFIDLAASAPLLGLISAGLLALAFLHGMPLALVALFGAYLAPVVTNGPDWGDAPLTAYLLLILITGYLVSALRGWRETAWAAGLGAVAWAMANLGDARNIPAALLLAAGPAAAIAAALWRRRVDPEAPAEDPLPHAVLIALAASSLAAIALWLPLKGADASVAAGLSIGLALLAALASIQRLAPQWLQMGVYGAIGFAVLLGAQRTGAEATRLPAAAATGFGLVVAAAGAAWYARSRLAAFGAAAGPAVAALVLTLLAASARTDTFTLAWVLPAAAAALTALVAAGLGRKSEAPQADLALAIWIWACALLAAVAVSVGLAWQARGIALAALAMVAAVLHARLAWRGFAAAAVALAVATLAALAGVGARALDGDTPAWTMAALFAAATAALWAAGRLSQGKGPREPVTDALSTGALICGLMGALFLLRLRGAGETPAGLEPLLETAIGVVLLLAAGVMSAYGARKTEGAIARWRPQLFLLAGLGYGIVAPLLALNPLWAPAGLPIKGPPIFDTLLIAYLAPAALLAPAAQSWVSPRRWLSTLYAAAATVFALAWSVLEIRRLFKGPGFAWGPETIGRAEACAYALLAFAAAFALSFVVRRLRERSAEPSTLSSDLALGATGLQVFALALAAFVFGFGASPWWGPVTRPFSDHSAVILLLALYGAGVGGWLLMARRDDVFAAATRAGAAVQLFLFVTLVVRYGFRGLDMHTAVAEARLETWAFSAIWALYGLGVLAFGAFRKDLVLRWTGLVLLLATTAKVFLFDMARLDGMVRAASFLAVGALLIVAALAARRFGGLNLVKRETEEGA